MAEDDDYMGDLSPESSIPPSKKDLQDILMKLRGELRYCLFCGCQYESMEELLSSCPGIHEDDH